MGDSDIFGDIALIEELHRRAIGIVPIGDRLTMGGAVAALARRRSFNFEMAIPCHYRSSDHRTDGRQGCRGLGRLRNDGTCAGDRQGFRAGTDDRGELRDLGIYGAVDRRSRIPERYETYKYILLENFVPRCDN
ncbi:hypothetical protein J2Z50_006633 [Ensifer mexicanus]|nr:hypothetical protein [Sinorhizobium mexicanum]